MKQLRKVTFLCLFICLHGTTQVTLDGFLWNFILKSVIEMSQPNAVLVTKLQKQQTFDMNYVNLSDQLLLGSKKKRFQKEILE
jgi:hypothetical protein